MDTKELVAMLVELCEVLRKYEQGGKWKDVVVKLNKAERLVK